MDIILVGYNGCLAKLPGYIKEKVSQAGYNLYSIEGRRLAESILRRDAIAVYAPEELKKQLEIYHAKYLRGWKADCVIIRDCSKEFYVIMTEYNYSLSLTKLNLFYISTTERGRVFRIADYDGMEQIEYFNPKEWSLAE